MIVLALRMALAGSKAAHLRLIITIIGITVSAFLLFSAFSASNAINEQDWRSAWMKTRGEKVDNERTSDRSVVIDHSNFYWHKQADSFYREAIQTFWVAGNSQGIKPPPGVRRWPRAGEFYLSPALAKLVRTTPSDQLLVRFGRKYAGIMGAEGLKFPGQLVAIAGTTSEKLRHTPNTYRVNVLKSEPEQTGPQYKLLLSIGMLSVLFPLMVFVNTSCTLGTNQREKILAALRLVGATNFQVGILSSVESFGSTLIGVCGGALLFVCLRSQMSGVFFGRDFFFIEDYNINAQQFGLTFLAITAITFVSTIRTTIRVGVSPLGIARQVADSSLSPWRIFPLVTGSLLLVLLALLGSKGKSSSTGFYSFLIVSGFLLIIWGIVTMGPLFTRWSGKLLATKARSAAALTAGRRMELDSVAIFRSVSGLVIAIFVSTLFHTALYGVLKSFNAERQTAVTLPLETVVAELTPTLKFDEFQSLVQLSSSFARKGITIPVYTFSTGEKAELSDRWIMRSDALTLGIGHVVGDGPIVAFPFSELAWGSKASQNWNAFPLKPEEYTHMRVERVIVPPQPVVGIVEEAKSEFVRLLGPKVVLEVINKPEESSKFGEIANIARLVQVALFFSMLVASCNMAVSSVGRMMERRQAFGLLRLSGMPVQTLRAIVIFEAVIPLLTVFLLPLGMGAFVTKMLFLAATGTNIPLSALPSSFWLTLLSGLTLSIGIAIALLPLTLQMTKDQVQRTY